MQTSRDLLRAPITYDIVVSDFGRDATIEYLQLVTASEKRLILSVLEHEKREFFDEYRRMMFTTIGDVAYFKEPVIAASTAGRGYLADDVLIGVGSTLMSQEFIDRVSACVLQECLLALSRGHLRLRVAIPCNGLSGLAKEIGRVIRSDLEIRKLASRFALQLDDVRRVAAARIAIHTVPDATMHYLTSTARVSSRTPLLVLGTRGTNLIYQELCPAGVAHVMSLEDRDYELIDRAIVASIGGDANQVAAVREQLLEDIIEPRRRAFGDLVVLEACTDFHLEVGLSTLKLFAQAMVEDCYKPKNSKLQ